MNRVRAEVGKSIKNATDVRQHHLRSLALSLLSGLLWALAFPPFNLHWLAWICLVPLLCQKSETKKAAFFYGSAAGFLANLIIFFWIWETFKAAEIGFINTLWIWMALALILSLYAGVFKLLTAALPHRVFHPFFAGAAWVGLEWIRSLLLTGFPWALLSHTQSSNSALLQLSSITGAGGISFVLVVFNSVVAELIGQRTPCANTKRFLIASPRLNFAGVVVFIFSLHLWGGIRLARQPLPVKGTLKVALLQGNIDQYQKWDALYEKGVRRQYEKLVRKASAFKPDVVIWPESSLPGWYPNQQFYVEWLQELVARSQTTHIVGAVTTAFQKDYNAAFLIDPAGKATRHYYKQHLVPFGEYVPWGISLAKWIPYLGEMGTFQAGQKGALFPVGSFLLSPNICYEAMFAPLIRRCVKREAHVIVNMTNDGWFLDTAAPEQHFVANIFRAVENGRPVLRAANTGISATIDAYGRRRVTSSLLVAGVYFDEIPVPSATVQTFYSRFGEWFSWLCLFLTFLCSKFLFSKSRPR